MVSRTQLRPLSKTKSVRIVISNVTSKASEVITGFTRFLATDQFPALARRVEVALQGDGGIAWVYLNPPALAA